MAKSKKTTKAKPEKVHKKLIIVHGWEGSPQEAWFPWLKSEMERKDWEVHVPALPNANNPKMHDWVSSLAQVADSVDENTYMVGYSLGCITILRFLENLDEKQKIGGAILVAGFDNPLNINELGNFFQGPLNWDKAKRVCKKFVVIHSEDDPDVPADNGIRMSNNLGAKKILVNGYKHFSGDDGINSLPLVLEELLEITS